MKKATGGENIKIIVLLLYRPLQRNTYKHSYKVCNHQRGIGHVLSSPYWTFHRL